VQLEQSAHSFDDRVAKLASVQGDDEAATDRSPILDASLSAHEQLLAKARR